MARVWVLGGRGMLGSAVMRALEQRAVAAVATGREVCLTDAGGLAQFAYSQAPTHIVNCAAMTAVDDCEAQQDEAMRINTQGPAAIARVAAQRGVPVLHVSTDYVFAGSADAPYSEESQVAPKTAYGRSKLGGEQAFWQALGRGAPGYVVRTAWLFGYGGRNFVSTMLKLMRERDSVQVVADQYGSPTFCGDLAEAICDLMGLTGRPRLTQASTAISVARPAPPGTYHFANAGAVSWHQLATATLRLAHEANLPMRCQQVEAVTSEQFIRPAKRPAYSVLSVSKVAAALHAQPRPFEHALREYIRGHASPAA